MAKKKLKIAQEVCIGCGTCASIYPDDIRINGDTGLAELTTGDGDEEAISVCPTGAISAEE